MRCTRVLAALACLAITAAAQTPSELKAGRALASAVKQGPLSAHAFLAKMPKGSDLHVHLSGAVYAETFIKDAVEDHICIDPKAKAFAKNPTGTCADGLVATSSAGTMTSKICARNCSRAPCVTTSNATLRRSTASEPAATRSNTAAHLPRHPPAA
ncbi:hypothetical protein AB4043_25755 [Terriglobus sp. YAF25]|uniref:hypothetical protein n=1 Tax=Terriglobus sp. YAF25 TaxID=3233080 RepID=UPI003F9629FA